MRNKSVKVLSFIVASVLMLVLIAGCTETAGPVSADVPPLHKKGRVRVATTTSLYDTGLWSYLEPMFEQKYGVELDIIYAGTGIALEYGRRGDVDAVTIHDRAREDQFVSDGYGVNRRCFAYNYFLVVGPGSDPASIESLLPEDAFTKLMEEGEKRPDEVKFVSRGDSSGTHTKEKKIWSKAGYDYEAVQKSGPWYMEAGRGMGPTLLMASEQRAYTLADMGTFLAYKGDLELVPIVENGEILLNVYAALAVNPEKHPKGKINIGMANNLINFLVSDEIQKLIGNYGVAAYGKHLFTPCGQGKCKEVGCPTWAECAKPAEWSVK